MELRENQNLASPQEDTPNPSPQPVNINMEIDAGLRYLRTLIQELQSTKKPSWVSLATSLDNIVSSIANSQGQLTHISNYRARMYEYYRTSLDKNQVRKINI